MARPRTSRTTVPTTTSLVASAVRLPAVREGHVRGSEAWQAEAWRLYDTVGELRFVANWVANLMSRASIVTTHHHPGLDHEVSEGAIADVMREYFGTEEGQGEMLRLTGLNLTVAGECYHVYRASDTTWHVLAAGKVKQVGRGAKAHLSADFGDGDGFTKLTKGTDLVIRIWQPHPMDPQRADSAVRANLSTLHEIERTSQTVAATLKSRLAGAGVFMLPSEMTFPTPDNAPDGASQADLFMATLGEAMMTPVADPDDPSAVVPIVITAPTEAIQAAKHIQFSRDLQDEVRAVRDNAVKRFALGMDVPPEMLTGLSDVNHWNAWLADESSVKVHIEPRLGILMYSITAAYLRPALTDEVLADCTCWKNAEHAGMDKPTKFEYSAQADTASIRVRPNRSREALELWDRGELNGKALRRETGFADEDQPNRNEMAEWLLRKIALGSTSPEQTQAAIEALGVDLPTVEVYPMEPKGRPDDIDNRRTIGEDARDRGRPQRPPNPPTEPDTVAPTGEPPMPALLAAAEVLVYRALERAGNRLKSKHSYRGGTQAADLYLEFDGDPDYLLNDAFSCVDRVADGAPTDFAHRLDTYCRSLIATKTPHARTRLAAHLALAEAV